MTFQTLKNPSCQLSPVRAVLPLAVRFPYPKADINTSEIKNSLWSSEALQFLDKNGQY